MTKKDNSVILELPDSVKARNRIKSRTTPLSAVRNKFLPYVEHESQEYLLGYFLGIQELHADMLPQIMENLKRAEGMDWNKDLMAPAGQYADDVRVVNYGSFPSMYKSVCEPWLAKYDALKADWQRRLEGKLSDAEVLSNVKARGGQPGNENAANIKTAPLCHNEPLYHNGSLWHNGATVPASQGTSVEYAMRRLHRDRPDLHAEVLQKKLSAHAAMIQAGFLPKTIRVPLDINKAAGVLVHNFRENIDELIRAIKQLSEK